jgi:hypothetical protein
MPFRRIVGAAMAGAFLLAGCGGQDQPTSPPAGGSTSSAESPGSTATGSTVSVTSEAGYLWTIAAVGAPQAAPQVVYALPPEDIKDAPPGEEYVTLAISATNAATDRPEPLEDLVGIDLTSPLTLTVPAAAESQFDQTNLCDQNFGLPSGQCLLITNVASVTPDPEGSLGDTQVGPGDSVTLILVAGPGASSITLGDLAAFFRYPISGDPATEVPAAGS